MCRKHHRIVNTKLIKEMGNELFWSYFENAIKQIPKTKLITENVVVNAFSNFSTNTACTAPSRRRSYARSP